MVITFILESMPLPFRHIFLVSVLSVCLFPISSPPTFHLSSPETLPFSSSLDQQLTGEKVHFSTPLLFSSVPLPTYLYARVWVTGGPVPLPLLFLCTTSCRGKSARLSSFLPSFLQAIPLLLCLPISFSQTDTLTSIARSLARRQSCKREKPLFSTRENRHGH